VLVTAVTAVGAGGAATGVSTGGTRAGGGGAFLGGGGRFLGAGGGGIEGLSALSSTASTTTCAFCVTVAPAPTAKPRKTADAATRPAPDPGRVGEGCAVGWRSLACSGVAGSARQSTAAPWRLCVRFCPWLAGASPGSRKIRPQGRPPTIAARPRTRVLRPPRT